MGKVDWPKVKLIVAAFGQDESLIDQAINTLIKDYGPLDYISPSFFIVETSYYLSEMGADLKKKFFSFEKLVSPEKLVDLKLAALDLEKKLAKDNKRQVNLDPGYVNSGGLVLSTTKFTGHRLYLGENLWGELTLHFHQGIFKPLKWTYPDYQRADVQSYLEDIRRIWSQKIQKN